MKHAESWPARRLGWRAALAGGLLIVQASYAQDTTLRQRAQEAHAAANTALLAGGDRAAARKGFLDAAVLDPSYAEPRYNLGRLAESSESWAEAEHWFGECARLAPRGSALHAKAQAALERVRRNSAQDSTAEGKRKRSYDASIARTRLLLAAGLAKEAFADAAVAQAIDPRRWEAPVAAASALQLQQRYAEADPFLRMALDTAPRPKRARIEAAIERNKALSRTAAPQTAREPQQATNQETKR